MTDQKNINNKSVEYLKSNDIIKDDESHIMDIALIQPHRKLALIMLVILTIVGSIPLVFLWYILGANIIGLVVIVVVIVAVFVRFLLKILKNSKTAQIRRENTHYFITSKRIYFKHDINDEYVSVNIDDIEYIEFQIERKTHNSRKGKKYPVDTFNNILVKLKRDDEEDILIPKVDRQPLEDNAEILNTTFGMLFRQRIIEMK